MRQARAARPAETAALRRADCLSKKLFPAAKPPWVLRAALALVVGALLGACAAQSPPIPPRVQHPQPVKDLTAEQIGQAFRFSFTLPRLATDGESLTKPLEVEIFRASVRPGEKPSQARFPLTPWISLSPQQVQKLSSGRSFSDLVPLPGQEFQGLLNSTLRFSVVTLTRGFRHRPLLSGPSNTATATVLNVSGPPAAPTVETTEKALVIRWPAPAETITEAGVLNPAGYKIYASTTGAAESFNLLGESRSTEFFDRDFRFGEHYYFTVRAVFSANGATAESQSSPATEVVPRDTFPPAVPRNLSAVETQAGVELVWRPDEAPDLAGYKVYRRPGLKPFELLTQTLLRTPVYRDATAQPGESYSYAVTAVDLSGNESAKSKQVTIHVR